MNNRVLGLFAALVVVGALWFGFCSPKSAGSGICPECSETPTGEPYATGEVTPEVTPTPEIVYIWPQRVDFDDSCDVTILDITLQAGDFLRTYPNYDGWMGEFDAERARLEDHDVDLDARITILDLTLTARAFGLSYEPPCTPVTDGL